MTENNCKELYNKVYEIIGTTTPMLFDCGELCNFACCHDNGLGMYLFPGEKEYINTFEHDFNIVDSSFKTGGVPVSLLTCTGSYNRSFRPLSCRIYPLFPYLRGDRLTIEFDSRAMGNCPLHFDDIEGIYIRGLFRLKVLMAANILVKHEPARIFLESLTRELDEISRFRL